MKLWVINNLKAFNINKKIINMIAMDNQPFSIVDDHGFMKILAKLNSRHVI